MFSFNNPFGACPTCHGFGNIIELDMDLVVPDPSKSILQNAIEPWSKPHYRAQLAELKRAARKHKVRLEVPWAELTDEEKRLVVEGGDDYDGIRGFFRWLERKKYKVHVRVFLSRYRGYLTCPDCGGARLRREARVVRVADRTIDQVAALTVREAQQFFATLALSPKETAIAEKILKEIRRRLSFLRDVGLDYLTLDRLSSTLSGGEAQRINLATSLGSALVGTLYVLDEPSIGLHSRDNLRLIDILRQLRDQGNTVLVVEHDADMIKVADHIVDLGLGAGEQGGRVVFSGTLDGLMHEARSLTSKYLRQELAIPVPTVRRRGTGQKIRLVGAAEHNLKGIDIAIPLNTLTCVTGVSGSGKSTLVHDVLYAAVKRAKGGWEKRVGSFGKLEGVEYITDAVLVDQAPIGRTPRSNPVTYLKAFDPIRELFAATKDARSRGLTASHFSFNVPGGRCEACQGEGEVRVEMQFLADVFVPCDQCDGKRFKPQVLEVRYRGRTIHQVLNLTVREALTFFSSSPKVLRRLQVLDEIGLGYLRLGQPATTLSGGEAQRIKIAAHLSSHGGERLLYILDEPTTGLHFDDIAKLLTAFRKLLEAGHTLLVIEHNLDVIKTADFVIDLGPEGGEDGGAIVATGTPEQVAQIEGSHTGRYLRSVLAEGRSHAYAAGQVRRRCRAGGAGGAGGARRAKWSRSRRSFLPRCRPGGVGGSPRSSGSRDRLRAVRVVKDTAPLEAALPLVPLIADTEDEIQYRSDRRRAEHLPGGKGRFEAARRARLRGPQPCPGRRRVLGRTARAWRASGAEPVAVGASRRRSRRQRLYRDRGALRVRHARRGCRGAGAARAVASRGPGVRGLRGRVGARAADRGAARRWPRVRETRRRPPRRRDPRRRGCARLERPGSVGPHRGPGRAWRDAL